MTITPEICHPRPCPSRTDCCAERINGVTVYVGDHLVGTVEWVDGVEVYEFPGLAAVGREITVVGMQGGDTLELVEVQVLGEFGKLLYLKCENFNTENFQQKKSW